MAGYTRQSVFNNGDPNDATQINAEFDQIEEAFTTTEGHSHDGTVGNGALISTLGIEGDTAAINITTGTVTTTGSLVVDDLQGTGTLTGTVTGNLVGDSEGTHTGTVTSYVEGTDVVVDDGVLDFDVSNVYVRSLTGDIILTLVNVPTSGSSKIELVLKSNDSLVTWPAGVVYEGSGLAPALGTTDRLIFSKYEGDASIYLMHTPMVV